MLKPGDLAPDFVLNDHNGKRVALADYKGKNVVLWFFPKADTPGWTAEGCEFRDHKTEFEAKNAVIFGVSFDTPAENKAFAEKFKFNFALLCDTDKKMGIAYGAADNTAAQAARRAGVVIGPDGKIREWEAKVSAREYPAQVLSRL
jgi:thioredoxin-dependent peroxiredoxin